MKPGESLAAFSRTMDGGIVTWPPQMQRCYGFSSQEALGKTSHQLLGTFFVPGLAQIEAALLRKSIWSGVLMHRCADGGAVLATNHWRMYDDELTRYCLVSEEHRDVLKLNVDLSRQLAAVLSQLAHEVSEPLTALHHYIQGIDLALQQGWPDLRRIRSVAARASGQIIRSAESIRRLRRLAGAMRDTGFAAGAEGVGHGTRPDEEVRNHPPFSPS